MKNVRRSLLAITLALAAGFTLAARAASLNVGDPAPKLQTGKFVQGDPVTEFAPGKAYIVEFWATWCGPCKASIPHLNETYNKFKDKGLIVIGQDCSEPDESKVAPFIKSMGDKMTYRVALDNKEGGGNGKMSETWMQAAGQDGIPTAFLIDTTGHIAWIGHPMNLKEKTIEDVLAGKHNLKAAAEEYNKQRAEEEKEEAAARKDQAVMEPFALKLKTALQQKDWDAALGALDDLEKVAPDRMAEQITTIRFKVLTSKKDYPAAIKALRQSGESHKDDPKMQNDLAWLIVSDKSIEHPDLELAQTMAQRATEAAKDEVQKSIFMDTLARVKFMQGSKEDAIALEQKALATSGDNLKEQLQHTLDSYKKGELPETD
jgi:thiol-disulfide isomerase/thioredoxin/predicted negative regulator of RcsB-dependent stress response